MGISMNEIPLPTPSRIKAWAYLFYFLNTIINNNTISSNYIIYINILYNQIILYSNIITEKHYLATKKSFEKDSEVCIHIG